MVDLEVLAVDEKNAIVDGPFGSNLKLSDYVDDGIPVLQGKNITNNKFVWSDVRFISENKAVELDRSKTRVGDILIVKIGSLGYSAELTTLNGYPYAIIPANLAKATIDENKINKKYLIQWLNTPYIKDYLLKNASQTAQPALSLSKIKKIQIPFPDRKMQEKIASILGVATKLIQKRKETIKLADEFLRSTFLEMFGDPANNPNDFKIVLLGDYTERITKGESPKWQGFSYQESGVLFVTSENVDWGSLNLKNKKYIQFEFDEKINRSRIKEDDLLINLVGASIGRISIATKEILPANVNQAVAVVSLKQKLINKDYALYYLLSPHSQNIIKGNIVEAARANISLTNLREFEMLLPPVETQNKFASIVKKTEMLKERYNTSLTEMENQFNSLMQRAFRGEL